MIHQRNMGKRPINMNDEQEIWLIDGHVGVSVLYEEL